MTDIDASAYRNTRFEIRTITQEGNAFALVCSDRQQSPDVVVVDGSTRVIAKRTPELEIHQSVLTDNEMRQIHAVLEMLEVKFAEEYDSWERSPDRVNDILTEFKSVRAHHEAEIKRMADEVAAAQLEASRIEAATILARDELARQRAEEEELTRNLATMRAAVQAENTAPPKVEERPTE